MFFSCLTCILLNGLNITSYNITQKTALKAPTFYYLKGVTNEEKTLLEYENEKLYNILKYEDGYNKEKYASASRILI